MSGWQVFFALVSIFIGCASLIMAFARTSPEDASSNLSKWVDKLGFRKLAAWIRDRKSVYLVYRWARIALIIAVALAALGVGAYRLTASAPDWSTPLLYLLPAFLFVGVAGVLARGLFFTTDTRTALVEFRQEAEKAGWRIRGSGNEEALDLLQGLRQAAGDEMINFSGRPVRSEFELLNRHEILDRIPREHWRDYEIEPMNFINASDNFEVATYSMRQNPPSKGSYRDLHANKSQILRWLNTEGVRLLAATRARLDRISIKAATQKFYDQTSGFLPPASEYADNSAKLLALCNLLSARMPILGVRRHGSITKPIPDLGQRYEFIVVNGDVAVKQKGGDIAFENISVLQGDLKKAIADIRANR